MRPIIRDRSATNSEPAPGQDGGPTSRSASSAHAHQGSVPPNHNSAQQVIDGRMSSFRSVLSSPEGSRTQLWSQPDSQPSSIRSTSQPGAETPSLSEHDDDVDNFDKMLSIEVDQPVGSMSISQSPGAG